MSMSRLVTSASISDHHPVGYTELSRRCSLLGCRLLHEDPASWRLDEHTCRSASDIVTVAESVWSLGAVTLALGGSFVWTAIE